MSIMIKKKLQNYILPSRLGEGLGVRLILPLLFFVSPVSAQQAGDIISGTVSDNFGPVMMANVVELDAANRIVASAQTEIGRAHV